MGDGGLGLGQSLGDDAADVGGWDLREGALEMGRRGGESERRA